MNNFMIILCLFVAVSISSDAHSKTLMDIEAKGYYQKLFISPIPSNLISKLTSIHSSFSYSEENEIDIDAYILGETLDNTVVVLKSFRKENTSLFDKLYSVQWLHDGTLVAEYQTNDRLELYPIIFSDGTILFIQQYKIERANESTLIKTKLLWLKDGKKIKELKPEHPISSFLYPNSDGSKIWYSTNNGLFVIEDQDKIRKLRQFENNDLYPHLTLSEDFEKIVVGVKNEVHLLSSDNGELLAKTDFTGNARRYMHFDNNDQIIVNFGDKVTWLKKEDNKLVEVKSVYSEGKFSFLTKLPSGKFIVKEILNFKHQYIWLDNGKRSSQLNKEVFAAEFFQIFSDDTILIPSRAGFEGADTELVMVKDGEITLDSGYFKDLRIRANDSNEMYLLLSNGHFVAVNHEAKNPPRIVWIK